MKVKKLLPLLVLLMVLLSCNIPGTPGEPATQPPAAPTDTPPLSDNPPTLAPTEELPPSEPADTLVPASETPLPTDTAPPPTVEPPPGVLPAGLYFLSNQTGMDQVWRLDADGVSLRQVTFEPAPVTDFSVSPGGKLAYVSDNDLWWVNLDGSERSQLVDGPPMPGVENDLRVNLLLSAPRWSPDGSRLAYGLNGVNLLSQIPGLPQLLLQSDPVPQPPDYGGQGPKRFYWPSAWSPDGSRLLLDFAYWPEAGGMAILPAGGGQPVLLTSYDGPVCCEAAWSSDGQAVYFANPYMGMFSSGLWRANAANGQGVTLIAGDPGNDGNGPFNMPGYPFQAPDGWLYYFMAQSNLYPEGDFRMAMYRAAADAVTNQQRLRSDDHLLGEALWAPDGSAALIVDYSAAPNAYPRRGRLIYLKADGSPALLLPGQGYTLRWGP